MVEIKTKYKWQGKDVVGGRFDTKKEAERFLRDNGWRKDPFNKGEYTKERAARVLGHIGVSIMQYVYIEEVKE